MNVYIHALFYLFALLSSIYLIYIIIHLISWNRLSTIKIRENTTPKTKISVIIAARNEELTIGKCLASIARQSYPSGLLEIIVVDDHSTDKTKEIAEYAFAQMHISSRCISN